MKSQHIMTGLRRIAAASTLLVAAGTSSAASLPLFPESINFATPACAPYGDFISCSAEYLNYLVFGNPSGTQTQSYVIDSSQGLLKEALVVFTGAAAAVSNNGGAGDPTNYGPNVDDAYQGFQPGSTTTYGTSTGAGEANNPNPPIDPSSAVAGETSGTVSNLTAWDIGLQQLVNALTINGVRHDLLVMFDNNQTGAGSGQDLLIWALVCARDTQNPVPGNTDKCFELVDENGHPGFPFNVDPTLFNTSRGYGAAAPTVGGGSDDPVNANGVICVNPITKLPVQFADPCPAGTVRINNNLGTNQTEFIVAIPELNAQLEALLAAGYDLVSVQFLATNNTNGFEDIFLLAGAARTTVPEPDTIALLALGLIGIVGIGALGRRRSRVR